MVSTQTTVRLFALVWPIICSLQGLTVAVAADRPGVDWLNFHGPNGNGSSPETGLLREWPQEGPRVLWRTKIKPGWSSPIVVGNDVYLCWTEELRGTAETVVCLDATTGEERWKYTYPCGAYWERNIGWARGGVRSTPVVSGDWLFTLGSVGHLHCLDRRTGKVSWQQNLWDEWNPSGEKGYVFSPLVEDGKLLLWYSDGVSDSRQPRPHPETEHGKHFVLCRALDASTGKLLWEFKEPHRGPARMGEGQTPTVATFGGYKCVLVTANCELKALRISDGKEVWKFACVGPDRRGTTIPAPLVVGTHIVHIPDQDAAHVVEFDRDRLDQPPKILWKKDLSMHCTINQFRHHEGFLYGFSGETKGESEQSASDSRLDLICVELTTGNVRWREKAFQNGVSLTAADGLLFIRSYQTLRLVEMTPTGYREWGRVTTHDVWKPTLNLLDFVQPALSRGRLFVRTPEALICYDVASQ